MSPDTQTLLDSVNRLPCSYSRAMMLRALRNMAGSSGKLVYLPARALREPSERTLAAQLLETMSRAEARSALMQRLGCSRTRAYVLLGEALADRAKAGRAAPPADQRPLALEPAHD